VAEQVYDDFMERFVPAVRALVSGDPLNEVTDIGPLISETDAVRVEAWVDEAISAGAKALAGGKRLGSFYEPTVLVDTTSEMKVMNCEVFGPVVCVVPFRIFPEAIDKANDSIYGLQAGVFSKNIDNINEAITRLRVGGVIINDVPTYRADHMPYGGVKMSGLGREGLKYAIEELTDIKMIVIQR
jgi:acyl-CoA reductase-like NAD-dependent aldehyde dehydrogenase